MITPKIINVYICLFDSQEIKRVQCHGKSFKKLNDAGTKLFRRKRDANLYLAGYLRFLAKVKTHHAQEMGWKAYRLTK